MAANNDSGKEIPFLSLIPEEQSSEEREDSTKYCSYKLLVAPGTTNTNKYTFTLLKVDGTQSIRAILKWTRDTPIVFKGLGINDAPTKYAMIQEMCSGATLTAFNAGVEASVLLSWDVARQTAIAAEAPRDRAGGETAEEYDARLQAARNGVARPAVIEQDMIAGVCAALTARCPYKVLEKQKRFMRRKMRKPYGMTTRQYVNHLQRINESELPYLPPFRGDDASFKSEEFKEIILFGIPNRWKKEMDKFDFDPFSKTVMELVEFCERMEASDDTGNEEKGNSNGSGSPKKKSKTSKARFDKYTHKKKGNSEKWCDYHESDTHTTAECSVLKKLKASKGDGNSTKKWKSKSDYAKDKAKKELNALKKKTKQVKMELNAATKTKRKGKDSDDDDDDDDDSSFHSLNMLEASMQDVDEQLNALEFSDTEEGEVL